MKIKPKFCVLCLLLLALGLLCFASCSGNNENSNGDEELSNVSIEEKENAKSEIDEYISKILPTLNYLSTNDVVNLKYEYFSKIDEATQSVEKVKKECLLKIELIYIKDCKEQEIRLIHSEYDYRISNLENIISDIEETGYYTGTRNNYESELSSLSAELRDIEVNRTKEKQYVRQQAIINGYGNSGVLQNELVAVDKKYDQQRANIEAEKEYLEVMWENRERYDEGNSILLSMKSELQELIDEANNEYTRRSLEIESELKSIG